MTAARPPLLAAVVDAVWTADADQLPLTRTGLAGRVWNRLGPVVSQDEVVAAATHLLPVGLVERDGDAWRPGIVPPEWAPPQPHWETTFWEMHERIRGGRRG